MKNLLSLIFMAILCHHFSHAQCSVNALSADVTCFGNCDGFAIANATGTAPFTYSWNTNPVQNTQSVMNLCSGTYIVTCTDSTNCVSSDTVIINTPTQMTISVTTKPTCSGCNTGEAVANVSGGTPPYTYFWTPIGGFNDSITNMTCGTYTVVATDINGCTVTAVAVIYCCNVTTTSTPNCYNDLTCANANGTATATPTGQAPFAYLWNTSPVQTTQTATGLCAGYYTVTVTDVNNCISTDSIRVYPQISISTYSTPASSSGACRWSAFVTVDSGASPPFMYTWYPAVGQVLDSIWGLCPGVTYSVCVTDVIGCIVCDSITINFTTNISNNSNPNFQIFPNPSSSSFIIKSEKLIIKEIAICNIIGETIYRKQNVNEKEIQLNKLVKGIYTIYITDENNIISTEKIIISP